MGGSSKKAKASKAAPSGVAAADSDTLDTLASTHRALASGTFHRENPRTFYLMALVPPMLLFYFCFTSIRTLLMWFGLYSIIYYAPMPEFLQSNLHRILCVYATWRDLNHSWFPYDDSSEKILVRPLASLGIGIVMSRAFNNALRLRQLL